MPHPDPVEARVELVDVARRAFDWAGTLAADVADRAVSTPHGLTWSNTECTRAPPELPPEPGFMQGAAGIAGWLARLHALRAAPPVPARPGPSWL
jgi:hypothetical protein